MFSIYMAASKSFPTRYMCAMIRYETQYKKLIKQMFKSRSVNDVILRIDNIVRNAIILRISL